MQRSKNVQMQYRFPDDERIVYIFSKDSKRRHTNQRPLTILAYFIVFYQKMVGKKESISETLDNNSQFSGDLVLAIILILAWIILDRVIYNLKKSSNYL